VPTVAVFDTNVVFSGVGWKGRPYECLELARAGHVDGVTCSELLDELNEKLQTKLSFTIEQAAETVLDLLTFLRVVPISGSLRMVAADPEDDKVLECALAATASYLVTGDHRHLVPLQVFRGNQIVTPAEFLAIVTSKKGI
jgi:putative PIN family toxin of toxin-antitoxin system